MDDRLILTGKELVNEIARSIQDANTEQLAKIAEVLGLYNIVNIDEHQDLITVKI